MVPEGWEAVLLRAGGVCGGVATSGTLRPQSLPAVPRFPSPAYSLSITSSRVPQLAACLLIHPLNVHLGPFFFFLRTYYVLETELFSWFIPPVTLWGRSLPFYRQ